MGKATTATKADLTVEMDKVKDTKRTTAFAVPEEEFESFSDSIWDDVTGESDEPTSN